VLTDVDLRPSVIHICVMYTYYTRHCVYVIRDEREKRESERVKNRAKEMKGKTEEKLEINCAIVSSIISYTAHT
jgi:Ca2+/Na+ antiporter